MYLQKYVQRGKRALRSYLVFAALIVHTFRLSAQPEHLSLAGKWRIALDGNYKDWPFKTGETERWYENELPNHESLFLLNQIYFRNAPFSVSDWITLPGTTDEAGIGVQLQESQPFTIGLERKYTYDGAFWIQRKITIPSHWEGKQVSLFLERTLGASTVYWDGIKVGTDYGYATPHQILIDQHVKIGDHLLTILINKDEIRYEHTGHHYINANGTSWNGIVGRIELIARPLTAQVRDLQIYPDVIQGGVGLKILLSNHNQQINKYLKIYLKKKTSDTYTLLADTSCASDSVFLNLKLPKPVALWSEFEPNLYSLRCELIENNKVTDVYSADFGMRSIGTGGGYILINGNKVLMRGTLDCGSFPVHGYPFMDKIHWLNIMNTCKSYGLNHIRFHTWCPPEAAFEAADESGIYLQVELAGAPYTELNRVLNTYGNHPSFCLLSLNNEVMGDTRLNEQVLEAAKKADARHLYTCTSHPIGTNRNDDYFVSAWGIEKTNAWPFAKPIVGITWGGGDVTHSSRFNLYPPETVSDYRSAIAGVKVPVIAHEMGQWAMFPDLNEIDRYQNAVLRNTNYERIKAQLERRGMLHLHQKFADASGRFSALLYKEEIESLLRTPGYAGYQLLGLNDYQGQTISIVGMLNSFWESKGLVTPEQHHSYCSSVVPLARIKKRTWNNHEPFSAQLSISNFSFRDMIQVRPKWSICDENLKPIQSGFCNAQLLPKGAITNFNEIRVSLKEIKRPAKLVLRVEIPDTDIQNQWDFWVYPDVLPIESDEVVFLKASDLNLAERYLQEGKKVLLQLDSSSLKAYRDPCFTPIFWNSIMKWPQRSHTLGILCNPLHKAFTQFPTEYHSNWQWWDVVMNGFAMDIQNLPAALVPIVQVIDSYEVNARLAYILECRVGPGKLMVSGINFDRNLTSRLASNQLKYSILRYMNSADFNPVLSIDFSQIRQLVKQK